jgi:hypothetical protein
LACLECPFLSRCDYRLRGLKSVRNERDAKALMEDHWHLKAQAAQAKKLVKAYVEEHKDVETTTLRAGVFTKESMSCDKRLLIRVLKSLQQDPVAFVEFPAKVLKKLRYDKDLGDDVSAAIYIDHTHRFNILKRGKKEEDMNDDQETC